MLILIIMVSVKTSQILGYLQVIVAISAIPSGLLMILQPDGSKLGMPIEILQESPFSDFLIPGVLLFAINGIAQGFASLCTFKQYRFYRTLSFILGIALTIWIIFQVYFINPIHYLQIIYFMIGILQVILAINLLNKKQIKR